MAASAYTSNENYAKELEDELMKYTRTDEQNKAEVPTVEESQNVDKKTEEVPIHNDMEVNIIDCKKSVHFELTEAKYEDTTECSSSFDYSDSGEENNATIANSEALSEFHDNFSMRKKKVTEHWRSFTQPLIWRAKLLELQIHNLDLQAKVYEKELEAYKKKGRTLFEDFDSANGVKSVAFSQINNKNDIFKRKKRRKVEETTDPAKYMSQHNFFAYYESKKFPFNGALKCSESKNPAKATQIVGFDIEFGLEDELLSLRGDPDNSGEQLLSKIFSMQSHVTKLKNTINKVMSQNPGIFACLDDLSFSIPSTHNTGDGNAENADTNEFLLPENGISSHGNTIHDGAGHAHFVRSKRGRDTGFLGNVIVKEEPDEFESNTKELEKPRSSKRIQRVCSTPTLTAPMSTRKPRGKRKANG